MKIRAGIGIGAFAGVLSLGAGVLSAQTAVTTPKVTYGTPVTGMSERPALVIYTDGRLEVRAHNSNLNQILDEIARRTGMRITGNAQQEHIFGRYGPGEPTKILVSLLEGSGSNMVLRVSAAGVPTELILTPRPGDSGASATMEVSQPAVASAVPPAVALPGPISGSARVATPGGATPGGAAPGMAVAPGGMMGAAAGANGTVAPQALGTQVTQPSAQGSGGGQTATPPRQIAPPMQGIPRH